MAVSQGQRLRKAAAKSAKRKVVAAEKLSVERRELTISKPHHIDMAKSPIRGCFLTADAFAHGMATLVVARNLSLGRVGVAVFLLDLWCLGVKDAFFRLVAAADFEDMLAHLNSKTGYETIEPPTARRLVRAAVEYAESIGLPPHPQYAEIEPIFGDVPLGDETFTFGKNGKPLYVPGPNASPRHVGRIATMLASKVGEGGFNIMSAFAVVPDGFFDDDDSDDDEPGEVIEGELLPAEPEEAEAKADAGQANPGIHQPAI